MKKSMLNNLWTTTISIILFCALPSLCASANNVANKDDMHRKLAHVLGDFFIKGDKRLEGYRYSETLSAYYYENEHL